MSNSNNVVNELFGAIDTLVAHRLEQLSYDKTIVCTIINDSKAKSGEYQVTDGSVKFWAKCENTNYRIDDQVRVSVPNGDTTQDKFIIGKYTNNDSTTAITYVNPLDSILQMSGNLCGANSTLTYGLKASGSTASQTLLWSADISAENRALLGSQIYDVIYVSADVKTILSNYDLISGEYGFKLKLGTTLAAGTAGPTIECVFTSADMLGNPYAFGIYTPQATAFDIASAGKISSIQLYLYQDGNFKYMDADGVRGIEDCLGENILVKNISVGLGTNSTNIPNKTVKLFTADETNYGSATAGNNTKHLQLAWYNKDEQGRYLGFNDGSGFADEQTYITNHAQDSELESQKNYDIPLDLKGLTLISETRQIKEILTKVARSIKTDLATLVSGYETRLNMTEAQATFATLKSLVGAQCVEFSTNITNCYNWYINALNEAAVVNEPLLPASIAGTWTFKGSGSNPGEEPGYYDLFSAYFNALKSGFYGTVNIGETTLENCFLPNIYPLVTGDGTYVGYKGIYDDFNVKVNTLLTQLEEQWTSALTLLSGNASDIASYFPVSSYTISEWSPSVSAENENKYCVYWYRYNPDATGDDFVGRGWERIEDEGCDNTTGINALLNATTQTKEAFKAIIFFNHERYESNVLTFDNVTPIVNTATAQLSKGISIIHGANSQNTYQNYSAANTLTNVADRVTPRQLTIQLIDENGKLANNELAHAQIYWYLPANATMLDYYTADLLKLNKDNNFTNDIKDTQKSEKSREGFICFYKTIGANLTPDDDGKITGFESDLNFSYRIKNYFTPTAKQNTIYCEVVKNDIIYKAEISMDFSTFGTSGTDYTLMVSPVGAIAAITPDSQGDNAFQLSIGLYDNKNNPIEMSGFTVEQIVPDSKFTPSAVIDGICTISCATEGVPCGILKVTAAGVQHDKTKSLTDLVTYYPLSYTANPAYYAEGASTVIYDSQGKNPVYYKDPYILYSQTTYDETSAEWITPELPAGTWSMQYTPSADEDDAWEGVAAYMPTLTDDGTLLPSNMWVEGGDSTTHESEEDGVTTKHYFAYVTYSSNNNVIWSQSILIMQNRYPSPMLNAWDGKMKIDDKNGTILSTMVGAGRKTSKNTFEGVLMGDIERGADFNPDNKSGLGIYGFNDGAQSFGLNIDGTAFFGKSGRGRILIDGNSGSISSASYQQNRVNGPDEPATAGMKIDLDDGYIDMLGGSVYEMDGITAYTPNTLALTEEEWNALPVDNEYKDGYATYDVYRGDYGLYDEKEWNENSLGYETYEEYQEATKSLPKSRKQSHIHLDVKNPYLYIHSANQIDKDKYLLYIGDEEYYLQTNDYVPSTLWDSTEEHGDVFNPPDLTGEDDANGTGTAGAGMKINLDEGQIDAYNFTLRGEDPDSGSFVKLSSDVKQMVKIKYRDPNCDTNGLDVLHIGTDDYVLRSFNWWDSGDTELDIPTYPADRDNAKLPKPLTGMEINLREGTLSAYAENDAQARNWFRIDASDDSNIPLAIGNRQNPAFKVMWDGEFRVADNAFRVDARGNVYINVATDANGAITASAFKVDNEGNLFINGSAFKVDKYGNLYINGSQFVVNRQGDLYIAGNNVGYIGENEDIASVTNSAFKIKNTGELLINETNGAFAIDPSGNLYIGFTRNEDGTYSTTAFNVDQYGNLRINGTAFQIDKWGNLRINDKHFIVDKGGNLYINAPNVTIDNASGDLIVDEDSTPTAFKVDNEGNLSINGDTLKILNTGEFSIKDTNFKITANGDLSLGDGAFAVDADGNLSINEDTFAVSKEGVVTMKKGSIALGDGAFEVDDEGNLNVNGKFKVDKWGHLTMSNTRFIVDNNGNLYVNAPNIVIDDNGELTIDESSTKVAFKITSDGDLSINGGVFAVSHTGNVSITSGAIELGYSETSKLGAFYVDDAGNLRIGYSRNDDDDSIIDSCAFYVAPTGELTIGNNAFRVDPNGNLFIGYTLNNDRTAITNSNFSITYEGVVTMKKGSISIGDTAFNVDTTGNLWINGETKEKATFSVSNTGTVSIKSGSITLGDTASNSYFTVNSATGLLETAGLKIYNSALFTKSCEVKIEGRMGINTTVPTAASGIDLSVNGKTKISGNLGIGTNPSSDSDEQKYTLRTSGAVYFGGSITLGTSYIYLTKDRSNGAYIYAPASDRFEIKKASTISLLGTTINIGESDTYNTTTTINGALNVKAATTVDGTLFIGNDTDIAGTATISGDVYIAPYTYDKNTGEQIGTGEPTKGMDLTFEVKGTKFWWWETETSKRLTFSKGILVGVEDI